MPSQASKRAGQAQNGSTAKGSKSSRRNAGKEGTMRYADQVERNQQNERSAKGLFSW